MDPDVHPFNLEENGDPAGADPAYGPQRKLKQRHVQMIAIAGTIGTGLFLGSGQSISGAGPVGALFAYAFVGSVAFASLCSIGEMTSMAPITGSFPYYASRWVDEALGFANYFFTNAVTIPAEISGAKLLLALWKVQHLEAYTVLILGVILLVNIFGVRYFGETEFGFSLVKLIMIFVLIVIGLVIDLGGAPDHVRRGFEYWIHPGPLTANVPSVNRFLGIVSAIMQAAAAYQGIEISTIAAAETENPRRNVARAMKKAFFRIFVFYIVGVLVAGLIVPSTDPNLLQPPGGITSFNGTAADETVYASPFVIGMMDARFGKPVVSVINAGLLTSAMSAGNSFLFSASRILYGLALRGQAPGIFGHANCCGVPVPAVLFTPVFYARNQAAFGLLAFITISDAFQWFYHLAAVGELITWAIINLTYLRFRIAVVLTQELDVIPPVIFMFFICWRFLHSPDTSFFWRSGEMDFVLDIPTIEETDPPVPPPRGFWAIFADKIF
ncbi:hypothetical protein SCLCIDRAFT_20641 [Scleroderma citrinum Foug A]|uniref:Amino acid permease/ SLC12A domain-containing protein n=1 Tax=Scleroderma citrinum Foug A TaxID=1036808 RepID=A0A0C3ATH3_9AGAM|nr:hypothetical protein SCLCIDRAFT_20641 [Scleroderma citrinum Foug A]